VINLELPWNPMRLEQRIGRVDRIGQHRTVHAFHLIAAGTGEHRLLANLREKIARAGTDIGAPNPLGDVRTVDADYRAARFVVGEEDDQSWLEKIDSRAASAELGAAGAGAGSPYEADGVAEARRLDAERTFVRFQGESNRARQSDQGLLAAAVRNPTTRMRLGARVLLIWELAIEDGCGRCVFSDPIAITVSLRRLPRARADCRWVDSLLAAVTTDVLAALESGSAARRDRAISTVRAFVAARVAREHDVAATVSPAPFQPGLFDRRVHHAQAAARAMQQQLSVASARRLATLERRAALSVLPPALRLVLVP
jgi:hypothetical protein